MTTEKGFPVVLLADRFYMREKDLQEIEKLSKLVWGDCRSRKDLLKKSYELKPKIIVSEYVRVDGEVMDASPNLKGIVVWGVGYDHIDVQAASERGIYVVNTRGSNAESVAEHTFGLIMALSRKIHKLDSFVREGKWITREETGLPEELRPVDLFGKTLGIIGLGAIGMRVARIAKGFNMQLVAHDPYISTEVAERMNIELVEVKRDTEKEKGKKKALFS